MSILLVVCMLLSSSVTVFAVGDEQAEGPVDETEAYLASLEAFTMEPANPYTPTEVKDLLTAGDTGHAYEPSTETAEPDASSYVAGEVLFARSEGGFSLFGTDDTDAQLAALGVTGTEVIGSFAEAGEGVSLLGAEDETVWYQAQVSGDVLETVKALEALDGIVAAEPNYIYTTETYMEPSEVEKSANWSFSKLHDKSPDNGNHNGWWKDREPLPGEDAPADINPGQGTVVAVIDTGVDYTHNDLAANMWRNEGEIPDNGIDDDGNGYIDDVYGVNVLASGRKAGDPQDDHGHGTHVAGIIAMSANEEGGVGLAWGAKVMAIKAGQATGTFTSANIAKAIKYAHQMGADVINMSFGGTEQSYLVEQALASAFTDCVLVAAAGNNGKTTTDALAYGFSPMEVENIYPAGYSYVLGVMATDANGNKAGFSNFDFISNGGSAEYELTAPGVDIYSTLPGNRYAKWSGTSMATPQVAAAAAILRSHFSDKSTYSTRFIYGQLASATEDTTFYADRLGYGHLYAALNMEDSCTNLPKPNIKVTEVFALDNKREDTVNDGDKVIDAGEVIDLGVTVRNQWGQTGSITVKADAISSGGVVNPNIEWITDTITLDPAGTYAESNNGYVWDNSYLTDVSNPIRFRVKDDTPNDYEIAINLTVTTTNGVDSSDETVYTAEKTFTFRVVSGMGIRGVISEDTTLDNEHYWIVENTVLVEEGATLTVEPGTQIQFWSSDYEDAYGGKTMAAILNSGTLNMIGAEKAPISMFPGDEFSDYVVEIAGDGVETLRYCEIINPRLGYTGSGTEKPVDMVDHCHLVQDQMTNYIRYLINGATVDTDSSYIDRHGFLVDRLQYSSISGFTHGGNWSDGIGRIINVRNAECNSYNDYFLTRTAPDYEQNSVYMTGNHGGRSDSSALKGASTVPNLTSVAYDQTIYHHVDTDQESGSKYVFLEQLPYYDGYPTYYYVTYQRELVRALLAELGGTLLCLNSQEEETFILDTLRQQAEATRTPDNTQSVENDVYLGYSYDAEADTWKWEDGNSYEVVSIHQNMNYSGKTAPYGYLWFLSYPTDANKYLCNTLNTDSSSYRYVLEIPDTLSDDEIRFVLDNFDYEQWFFDYCQPKLTNCAILNPVLNTEPETWAIFTADPYDKNIRCYNLSGNYWGTDNDILRNKMINDADDFAGTLGDIVETPTLTLQSDSLADIYPFATAVWLEDSDGNIVSTVTPGETYEVHVTYNRDMDPDTQPTVTYGPAKPYTDFGVRGDWASAREWVGTTTVSPVMTAGTQYFRTSGGCAADDHWLVCGNDILRFQFEVSTTGALAMLLQASGGANKVELSWAQNDYETLAGYNLYRSTKADSGFTKLNDTIITGTEYVDTAVQPGVTYYYYFKVVNTEGTEESNVSNTASAAPIDNVKPTLTHTKVTSAKANTAVTLSAVVMDNIAVTAVKAFYRVSGTDAYTELPLIAGENNRYVGTIPASAVTANGIDYYLAAYDGDGNVAYSGTAQVPHNIAVNGNPYISGIVPGKVSINGGTTVTVLGGNFTEGLTLKVGGQVIERYSLVDAGQITFLAPAKAIGSYFVTLTNAAGYTATSPTALAYTDEDCIVQIPTTMEMTSGVEYAIPVYVSLSGELTDFEAAVDLPYASFTNISVEKADSSAGFSLDWHYSGGVLKIACAAASNINPGSDKALLYIKVTPRTATVETTADITLHDVLCNGAAIDNLVSGSTVISPNFSLNAQVQYFKDGKAVQGVKISAAGVEEETDENGQAALSGIKCADVIVVASKRAALESDSDAYYYYEHEAVGAFDAALVLRHSVGKTTLDDNQQIAGDVDGNGKVNAHDASLILRFAVGLEEAFPAGAWKFTPASEPMTLTTSTNTVTFTAILIGDVDGNWKSEQ